MVSVRVVRKRRLLAAGLIAMGVTLPMAPATADPPDWAPAHGWRHHHDDDGRRVVILERPRPVYAVPAPAPAYAPPPMAAPLRLAASWP